MVKYFFQFLRDISIYLFSNQSIACTLFRFGMIFQKGQATNTILLVPRVCSQTHFPHCRMSKRYALLVSFFSLPWAAYAQQAPSAIVASTTKAAPKEENATNAPPTQPSSAPVAVLVAADANGFQLNAADKSFSLRLRGDVQADGRFFSNDGVAPGAESFYLRRVRVVFQGTMFSRFDFKVMPNFGLGRAELQDAYVDARFTSVFGVRAGKFKLPVGLEVLQSPTTMFFIERAYPSSLVPNRDVGVEVHGELLNDRLSYQFGVFNGSADGASIDADANNSKDVAARLFTKPFRASASFLSGLGLGIAVTAGTQEGSETSPELPAFRTSGRQTFFRYLAGAEAGSFAHGQRTRIASQGYYYQGRVGLLGEYVISRQEVQTASATAALANRAWQVAGSFVLTGEDAAFGRLQPRAPYDGQGHWGAVEVVGRLHGLTLDEATFPTFANPASASRSALTWGVGINWHLNSSVRLMVNYEQTRFEAAAGASPRDAEHLLLSRFQIAF